MDNAQVLQAIESSELWGSPLDLGGGAWAAYMTGQSEDSTLGIVWIVGEGAHIVEDVAGRTVQVTEDELFENPLDAMQEAERLAAYECESCDAVGVAVRYRAAFKACLCGACERAMAGGR